MKSKRILVLVILAMLAGGAIAWFTVDRQPEVSQKEYGNWDRKNALILCMTVEYVRNFQLDAAERDSMPVCAARWQTFTQTVSFEDYRQAMLQTPYRRDEDDETKRIRQFYNDILMGIPLP